MAAYRLRPPARTLVYCILAYFAVRFAQIVVGPVVPLLLEEFTTTRGAVGAALTGMWVAYALLQLPSGLLADRIGGARVVVLSLLATVATVSLMALSPTLLVFALATVGLGAAAGAYYNPATALLANAFDEFGGAIGGHRIGGQAAGVVAPIAAAAIAVRFGWRPAIAIGAVLALVTVPLFLGIRSSEAGRDSRSPQSPALDRSVVRELLRRPHTRNTTVLMTLVEFVGLATMAFLPTLLVEHQGYSLGLANGLFAIFFAVSALSQPLGGRLSDRLGRDRTLAVLAACGVLGFAMLVPVLSMAVVVLGIVLASISTSATTVIQSRMLDGLSVAHRGTGFGLFRTSYLLIGAPGTVVVGTTADMVGWSGALWLLTGIWALVLVGAILLRQQARGQNQ